MDKLKQSRNIIYSVIIAISVIAILVLCIDFSKNSKKIIDNVLPDNLEQQFNMTYSEDSLLFDGMIENLQNTIHQNAAHYRYNMNMLQDDLMEELQENGKIRSLKYSEEAQLKEYGKNARRKYAQKLNSLKSFHMFNERMNAEHYSVSELEFLKDQIDIIETSQAELPEMNKVIAASRSKYAAQTIEDAILDESLYENGVFIGGGTQTLNKVPIDELIDKDKLTNEAEKLRQALFPTIEDTVEEAAEEAEKLKFQPVDFKMPRLSKQASLAIAAMGAGIATVWAINQNRGPEPQFYGQRPNY